MVGQGESAHLECAVEANPLKDGAVVWRRIGDPDYDMESKTETTQGSPFNHSQIYQRNDHKNAGLVMLTVLNATAEDSGAFACLAQNGVGGTSEVLNTTFLLVRRKY